MSNPTAERKPLLDHREDSDSDLRAAPGQGTSGSPGGSQGKGHTDSWTRCCWNWMSSDKKTTSWCCWTLSDNKHKTPKADTAGPGSNNKYRTTACFCGVVIVTSVMWFIMGFPLALSWLEIADTQNFLTKDNATYTRESTACNLSQIPSTNSNTNITSVLAKRTYVSKGSNYAWMVADIAVSLALCWCCYDIYMYTFKITNRRRRSGLNPVWHTAELAFFAFLGVGNIITDLMRAYYYLKHAESDDINEPFSQGVSYSIFTLGDMVQTVSVVYVALHLNNRNLLYTLLFVFLALYNALWFFEDLIEDFSTGWIKFADKLFLCVTLEFDLHSCLMFVALAVASNSYIVVDDNHNNNDDNNNNNNNNIVNNNRNNNNIVNNDNRQAHDDGNKGRRGRNMFMIVLYILPSVFAIVSCLGSLAFITDGEPIGYLVCVMIMDCGLLTCCVLLFVTRYWDCLKETHHHVSRAIDLRVVVTALIVFGIGCFQHTAMETLVNFLPRSMECFYATHIQFAMALSALITGISVLTQMTLIAIRALHMQEVDPDPRDNKFSFENSVFIGLWFYNAGTLLLDLAFIDTYSNPAALSRMMSTVMAAFATDFRFQCCFLLAMKCGIKPVPAGTVAIAHREEP